MFLITPISCMLFLLSRSPSNPFIAPHTTGTSPCNHTSLSTNLTPTTHAYLLLLACTPPTDPNFNLLGHYLLFNTFLNLVWIDTMQSPADLSSQPVQGANACQRFAKFA